MQQGNSSWTSQHQCLKAQRVSVVRCQKMFFCTISHSYFLSPGLAVFHINIHNFSFLLLFMVFPLLSPGLVYSWISKRLTEKQENIYRPKIYWKKYGRIFPQRKLFQRKITEVTSIKRVPHYASIQCTQELGWYHEFSLIKISLYLQPPSTFQKQWWTLLKDTF